MQQLSSGQSFYFLNATGVITMKNTRAEEEGRQQGMTLYLYMCTPEDTVRFCAT